MKVFVILRLDVHGLRAALSKRSWIVLNMPDGTVQLTNRKKPWTERITFATLCILGKVTLTQVKIKKQSCF